VVSLSVTRLSDDLARIAEAARAFAEPGEDLAAVIPAEPAAGTRVYLCAYGEEGDDKTWLALDDEGRPIPNRALVRESVSIAAMCEIAEEVAAGGKLDQLRAELVALRETEHAPEVDEAEDAVFALERTLSAQPRIASPAYLDEVGAATRRLEEALGEIGRSPFVEALKHAVGTVDDLTKDVERNYKQTLT
jgi:hypothetical protein